MSELPAEQTLISNAFGTVTSKRVIYNRSKGWLSGGSREDIPLKHVTSVSLEISRSVLAGILFLLLGVPMLTVGTVGTILIGAIFAFIAVLLLWGSPAVSVNTAGNDWRPAKGAPWHRADAQSFVDAVRAQLFRE